MGEPAIRERREIDILGMEVRLRRLEIFKLHQPAAIADKTLERIEPLAEGRMVATNKRIRYRRHTEIHQHGRKRRAARSAYRRAGSHRCLTPLSPGRVPGPPEFVKHHLVAKRIHRLPETEVAVGTQLRIPGKRLERRRLPRRLVAFDPVNDFWVEHKEAAIYVRIVTGRFFHEGLYSRAVDLKCAVTSRRPHRSYGRQLSMVAMKSDCGLDIDIREAIAIGEAERLLWIEIAAYPLESTTGQRHLPGIHECDPPRLDAALMISNAVLRGIDGDIG